MSSAQFPVDSRAPVLVTGGAGFIGCNVADRLARDGHDVLVYDAMLRPGVERNIEWLRKRHPGRIAFVHADVRDRATLAAAIGDCSAVFHFAAQVAVTSSLDNPREDFAINVAATLDMLEELRNRPRPLIFASTNKVYGDLADLSLIESAARYEPEEQRLRAHGLAETKPLDFHTPYGCSKGAAEQYVLDYARTFGLATCVMRMSCIYGPRQMGTEDQGWVAHFLLRALAGEEITIYGDGRQVRDILFIDDAVEAYLRAFRNIGKIAGTAFNLGGGPSNAVSLREVLREIAALTGVPVITRFEDWRRGDQRYFVADTRKLCQTLALPPPMPWRQGLANLAGWIAQDRPPGVNSGGSSPRHAAAE